MQNMIIVETVEDMIKVVNMLKSLGKKDIIINNAQDKESKKYIINQYIIFYYTK